VDRKPQILQLFTMQPPPQKAPRQQTFYPPVRVQ